MIIGYKLIHIDGSITITTNLLTKTATNNVITFEILRITEI
jgi:hypothetical protein